MIPLLGKIERWIHESSNYKRESLYAEGNFPLNWLVKKVLSKIPFDVEAVDFLKRLHSEGLVVYALKDRSQLNSLIIRDLALRKGIPTPVYSHDVNMTLWQPFPIALRVVSSLIRRFFCRRVEPEENNGSSLQGHLAAGHALIIHLGGSEFFENRKVEEALASIVEAQKVLDRPVYLVPVLVTYGRRREKEKESLLNILFGQTDNTMFLQRLITFLRYANKIFVMPTEAVELSQFTRESTEMPAADLIQNLRRELIERIDEEKTALVGSFLKSRQEHISMVLKEPELISYMENMAAVGKKDYPALVRESRKYLNEIAADYSNVLIEVWARILSWLWNNIYDGVVVDRE